VMMVTFIDLNYDVDIELKGCDFKGSDIFVLEMNQRLTFKDLA
jgi:hypothetical protein